MRKPVFVGLISVFLAASIASAATWSPRAPLPAAQCTAGSGLALVNGSIIVVGQLTHDEYSVSGNAWSTNTAYPRNDRTNLSTAVVANDVFFVGGTTVPGGVDKGNFDSYNQVTDSWALDVGSFFPNAHAGTIFHAGHIYSFGGTTFGGSSLAFRFVPGSPTIFVLLSMPTGRSKPAVVEHAGKLWVIGGTQGGIPITQVEYFDPIFGSWTSGPGLPLQSAPRAAGVVGGDIHVLLDAGLYRLSGGVWSQVGPAAPQSGSSYAAIFAGNDIHAIGGCSTEHYALAVSPVVADTTAPTIASVTPSIAVLNPPNHKMVPVTISVAATDDTDANPVAQIVSVTSNEPDDGLGDGDTPGDIVITGPLSVQLRAERSGKGSGRVYTITVAVSDSSGNVATGTTTVVAPRK